MGGGLAVKDLEVSYARAVRALQGVSLDVPQGKVVAVLGSNGAGKTTLLRSISGVLGFHRGNVDCGSITFDGRSILDLDPARVVRSGIVQVPEGRRIFGRLTVEENLRAAAMGAADKSAVKRAWHQIHDLFPVLADRRAQRASLLSGGEQQMLAIGRALITGPKLLVLDEPSLGLAPKIVGQIAEVIREINGRGISVLLVEQNAAMALAVSHRAYVLEVGQVLLSGPADDLAGTDQVRRLYLGEGDASDASDSGAARTASAPDSSATYGGPEAGMERPRLTRWTA